MTATEDTINALLKEHYGDTDVTNMMLKDAPLLGRMPKREDLGGKYAPLPVEFAPSAGVSPSFSAAQASKADVEDVAFNITSADLFSLFSLDHKAIALAKRDEDAFLDIVESRVNGAMKAYKKILCRGLFLNHGGALAEIEANDQAGVLTLTDRAAMAAFDVNMQIQPATTDGTTGAVINDIQTISKVDRKNRTITAASGDFPIANYAPGNKVFLRGGFGKNVHGLASWFPTTPPAGNDSHFGVNRSVDNRLYGVIRVADANIDETLNSFFIELAEDIGLEGGTPDLLVVHNKVMSQWLKQLDGKAEYDRLSAVGPDGEIAGVGFRSVKLLTSVGEIDVVADRNCPLTKCYMLQTDTLRFWSVGKHGTFLTYEDDDSKFMRHGAENALEGRIGGYVQVCCNAPGWNGVGDITELVDTAA